MTTEQLMRPRYLKIADYPGSTVPVGSIWEAVDDEADTSFYDHYPHLFKRLEWWQRRDIEHLPAYLKTYAGLVFKTEYKLTPRKGKMTFKTPRGEWGLTTTLTYLLPATEEEYNSYKQRTA